MTSSEPENAEQPEPETHAVREQRRAYDGEVLGVLTGQVPVRSMPVAGQYTGEQQALDGEWLDDDGSA